MLPMGATLGPLCRRNSLAASAYASESAQAGRRGRSPDLPRTAVGNSDAEDRFRLLRFLHLVRLLRLLRIVVAPEPRQRLRQIQRALRDRMHARAETEMEIVAF